MIILGVILLILGFVFSISILWTIGIILVVIGAVLWLLGAMGRTVGPRRHYWEPLVERHWLPVTGRRCGADGYLGFLRDRCR